MKILLTTLNTILFSLILSGSEKVIFCEKESLSLRNGAKSVTQKVAVSALTAYRLNFSAKVKGPGNFEDSPQLEYLFMSPEKAKKGRKMACWKIIFYDASGKEIKGRHASFWQCVFSKDFQSYHDEFYTPGGAGFMALEFSAGEAEDSLHVKDIAIEKIDVSQILNLNPEFKLGPYNYSGIGELKRGKMTIDEKGITRLDLRDGYVITDGIPVKPGENLRISISGTGFRKMGAALKANYYDATGKEVSRDNCCLRIAQGEKKVLSYEFIVPNNACSIKLVMGGSVFDWIKLEKSK